MAFKFNPIEEKNIESKNTFKFNPIEEEKDIPLPNPKDVSEEEKNNYNYNVLEKIDKDIKIDLQPFIQDAYNYSNISQNNVNSVATMPEYTVNEFYDETYAEQNNRPTYPALSPADILEQLSTEKKTITND